MKKELPVEITPETKCGFCTNAQCCTYFTEAIETPRSKYDFEHLLWQISHGDINIYKDKDGWTLLINNKCNHLQNDGRCGIYEVRPQICRDHDNDWCEFDEPAEENWDLYFRNYDELRAYCKKRFKKWDR